MVVSQFIDHGGTRTIIAIAKGGQVPTLRRSGFCSSRESVLCWVNAAQWCGSQEQGTNMSLRINDIAPDFTAETTQGKIRFHDWIGDQWAVLFSHPKDFTPVCTTELGYMAKIEPEFKKRNAKLIGLSVDPVDNHHRWAADIEETQGTMPKYPMIGDHDLAVAKLYNMLPAEEPGTSEGRTAATNATVRSVFVDRPRQADQADADLPDDDRAQLRRDPARARLDAAHGQAQGRHAGELEAGRRRDHRAFGVSDEDAKKMFPSGFKTLKPYLRITKQPR